MRNTTETLDKLYLELANVVHPETKSSHDLDNEKRNKILRQALVLAVDEMEHYPVNTPTCPECTEGQTPNDLNTGLCGWHHALKVLREIPESEQTP
jgi:hypothetical protein